MPLCSLQRMAATFFHTIWWISSFLEFLFDSQGWSIAREIGLLHVAADEL
jgi:hypothetical protein